MYRLLGQAALDSSLSRRIHLMTLLCLKGLTGMSLFTKAGRNIFVVNNEYVNREIMFGNRDSGLPETDDDVLKGMMAVTHAERIEVGAQITRWHEEARGYKIRHVPATLPDLLMTQDLIDWESREMLGRATEQERSIAEAQRDLMRTSRSDYEIAMPKHEIEAMARGEGYYRSLPVELRLAQIDWMLTVFDELYPSLRLFFFDARQVFSSPITIFGPLQAVIYLGRHYLAFRDSERVQLMTQHFDWLVRESVVAEREVPDYLRGLRSRLG